MDDHLNPENLSPESAHLVKALMDPYHTERDQDETESTALRKIDWIASKDFDVEVVQRQIHEYIQTWDLPSAWLYSLDYLGATREDFFAFYHYRARFSTPTAQNPIVGTACVYFAVSTVHPETQPVNVHFVMESCRLVNRAGEVVFREKWLADVIENKMLLRKTVHDLWTENV